MDDLDLERRELCPDGRCVGVIGEDGRCGQCGHSRETVRDSESDARHDAEVTGPPTEAQAEAAAADIDPDARVLCWDDRCVGIIGGDGRCGTCGRRGPNDLVIL